jgi:branched-chain amino acid transport system permease protein
MTKLKRFLLVPAILAVLVMVPLITHDQYYLYVLSRIFIWGTMAMSLFLTIRTGLFNLGHAAFMAMGAYVSATLVTKLHVSFWLTLPIAAIVSVMLSILIGIIIIRLKGMYFVLVTASLCEVVKLIIASFPKYTGGYSGIHGIPAPGILGIDFGGKIAFYYMILFFMTISFLICYRVWHSEIGRIFRGIAANDGLSESVGIPTVFYKVMSFAVASLFASLCGSMIIHLSSTIDPLMFSSVASVNSFFYMVVGGVGSIFGPLIGTAVAILIEEVFRFMLQLTPAIFGGIVIMIVIFLPGGVITFPKKVHGFFVFLEQKKYFTRFASRFRSG